MNMLQEGSRIGHHAGYRVGVPIPLEGYENKRIYVWFDAVTGYLSASIEWAKLQGEPESGRSGGSSL